MSRTPALTPEQFSTFGEMLKFLRRRAGLSQRELSIAVGYSESQISRLEQNQRAPDPAAVAARFVSALDLETERAWTARLLELAAAAKDEPEPLAHQAQPSLHNLRIALTRFIGREREITELKQLLSSSRLVTLTGAGGVGKTRLAIQLAYAVVQRYPDGAWLVDLAPLSDPALVPSRVALVFGLPAELQRSATDTLIRYLRAKDLLLVLDNCEHLAAASALLTDELLHACPDLRVMTTSRELLGVEGEKTYRVPPLAIPPVELGHSASPATPDMLTQYEAVRLFVERAQVVRTNFVLTPANAAAVASICRQLDGIPLALELAAARIRQFSPQQIAERLDDGFRLLTDGGRSQPARHHTLRAAMDWSYDLLSDPERVLLHRLSVFAGGWTFEAAETVCAGDVVEAYDVLDLLAQLIDKSLVLVEEEGDGAAVRYRLLETIRQYALARLVASGEADAVQRRHAAYYVALAESGVRSAVDSLQPRWLKRVAMERDNLRAALAWSQSANGSAEMGLRLAAALMESLWRFGYWSEGRLWLQTVLAHADAEGVVRSPARAIALLHLGNALALQGDPAAAQAQYTESLIVLRELGDRQASARVLERLGWLAREHGDAVTACLRLEESLALGRELGDPQHIASALNSLGEVAVMQEDTVWATTLLDEGLTLSRELDDTVGIAWALNHMGHVAQLQGEYGRATRLHGESLALFLEFGARYGGVAWALQSLGEIALAEGKAALATEYFAEALEYVRDSGDRARVAWCLASLAGAAALGEEPERAAWLWGAAEALRQSIGARPAPASRVTRERLMAQVRAQLGDAAFEAAWADGQAASPEQAIVRALHSAA